MHWCHMDYYDDVFISFLDKDSVPYILSIFIGGRKTLGLNLKHFKLFFKDERRSYGLVTT